MRKMRIKYVMVNSRDVCVRPEDCDAYLQESYLSAVRASYPNLECYVRRDGSWKLLTYKMEPLEVDVVYAKLVEQPGEVLHSLEREPE